MIGSIIDKLVILIAIDPIKTTTQPLSDAIHDFGDAISIGIAYLLEKKSKKRPNSTYTYGYARYSILGALITLWFFAGCHDMQSGVIINAVHTPKVEMM